MSYVDDAQTFQLEDPSYVVGYGGRNGTHDQENGSAAAASTSSKMHCCARFNREIAPCQPWFKVQDANGRKIDIPESFAPGTCFAFLSKFVCLATSLFLLAYSWTIRDSGSAGFYLAYFTDWALLFANLYLMLSFF